jgi:hypothetical protein
MAKLRAGILLAIILVVCTCIDPYTPKLKGYDSLLTVDALITDANTSCIVKLTRTLQNQNDIPPAVSDAFVYLTDDAGNTSTLINAGRGIYKTDSIEFRGTVGRTYVLHISTNDGKEYESEPCLMYPVPEIESVYFEKDQQLTNNGTQSLDGISIYLDSKDADNNQYFRWSYEETWKYKVPYPKKFNYVKGANPDFPHIVPVNDVKEFCWNNRRSGEILIRSISNGQAEKIKKQTVFFIPTGLSSRLLYQYTVLVKQYSISRKEYEFWDNLKQVNETGNDIFARQPYSVLSNLHNTTNPKERVLGFFQVSAVSQQRKNIVYDEVGYIGLPIYSSKCSAMSMDRSFWNTPCMCPPPTWDDVYRNMSTSAYKMFTEAITDNTGRVISRLIFTTPECADCEVSGSANEPYFWKDIKW